MQRRIRWFIPPFLVALVLSIALACAPAAQPGPQGGDQQPARTGPDWRSDFEGFVKSLTPNPPADTRPPKRGGTYIYAAAADPPHFDPAGTISWPAHAQWTLGYNRLLAMKTGIKADPYKWELGTDLAKSWTVSPDGKTYTFKMQEGVKWHNKPPLNGRELTSADIKYSYERLKNSPGSPQAATFDEVASIETPDNHTLQITLKSPSVGYLAKLGSLFPYIHAKELVELKGDLKLSLVGTGPFMFENWERGVQVNWKRNPDYWEKGEDGKSLPYLEALIFRIIPDESTRLAAFRTNQVHNGSATGRDTLKAVLESLPDAQVTNSFPEVGIHLSGQLDQQPWSDVRFRRAVSLALNRQKMRDSVWDGLAFLTPSAIPWFFLFDSPEEANKPESLGRYQKWEQDLDQAKKLMAEAGYTNVKLKLYNTPQYGVTFAGMAASSKEDLAKIGIDIEIIETDYTKFYTGMYLQGKWDNVILSHQGNQGIEADDYAYGHLHTGSSRNFWHISSPELDRLTEAQRVEADPKKRRDILRQINTILVDQVYQVWMPKGYSTYTLSQGYVRNFRTNPSTGTGFSFGPNMKYVWLDK
ncbi:MAG: ABC transporter substrate-binding protein [Chloroflexi bacterium]|nr:ABC transporter substrate-binding protein [Chloroflexota bacterium]